MNLTYLTTDNDKVNIAYYTAVSDIVANIKPMVNGSKSDNPVLIAGIDYYAPWTRDTAINVSNAGYLFPKVAVDTLMAVTKNENGKFIADGAYGQDWDSVIWVLGAWRTYLYTGDNKFLKSAYQIGVDSLEYYKNRSYNAKNGLFKGPACYGDGVAAYPDIYATKGESGILAYAGEGKSGTSIDMYTLSTNCVYYGVYKALDRMAEELGLEKLYADDTKQLKLQINNAFWNGNKGYYNYIIDDFGGCDYFEGLGNAFAILFGIADNERAEKIFSSFPNSKCGYPCVYPSFKRYDVSGENEYGRHSGTIWPHIQSFWADASAKYGRRDCFDKEFNMLTNCAVRDGYFAEIYHPDTSLPYGGRQEDKCKGIISWSSGKKQTWSATGYLHMIFANIIGMKFEKCGIAFKPYLLSGITILELTGFVVQNTEFDITVRGKGSQIKRFTVNGEVSNGFVAYDGEKKTIEIELYDI